MAAPRYELHGDNGSIEWKLESGSIVHAVVRRDDDNDFRIVDEADVGKLDDDFKSAVVLRTAWPVLRMQVLVDGVSVKPPQAQTGQQRHSIDSIKLTKLMGPTPGGETVVFLRPGDAVHVLDRHHFLIHEVMPSDDRMDFKPAASVLETVQVDSSIPQPDELEAEPNKPLPTRAPVETLVQVGQSFTAGAQPSRSRTPTQASRGIAIEETPATSRQLPDLPERDEDSSRTRASPEPEGVLSPTDFVKRANTSVKISMGGYEESQSLDSYLDTAANMLGSNTQTSEQRVPNRLVLEHTVEQKAQHESRQDSPPFATAPSNTMLIEVQGEQSLGEGSETESEAEVDPLDNNRVLSASLKPEEQLRQHPSPTIEDEVIDTEKALTASDEPVAEPSTSGGASRRSMYNASGGRKVSPFDGEQGKSDSDILPKKRGRKRKMESVPQEVPTKKKKTQPTSSSKGAEDPYVGILNSDGVAIVIDEDERTVSTLAAVRKPGPGTKSSAKESRLKRNSESSAHVTPKRLSSNPKSSATPAKKRLNDSADSDVSPEGIGTAEDPWKCSKLLFSNSSMPSKPSILKFFRQHGLEEVKTVTPKGNWDILVVGEGDIKKTPKLLMSLVLQKIITSDKWMVHSAQKGKITDPALFEPPDLDIRRDRRKLFKGRHIFVTRALKKEYGTGFKDIQAVVKLAGAESVVSKVLRSSDDITKGIGKDVVVLALERDDLESISLMDHGVTCYTKDLLSTSILRGELELGDDEFRIAPLPSQSKRAKGGKRS